MNFEITQTANSFLQNTSAYLSLFEKHNYQAKAILIDIEKSDDLSRKLTLESIIPLCASIRKGEVTLLAQYVLWCLDETLSAEEIDRLVKSKAIISRFNL